VDDIARDRAGSSGNIAKRVGGHLDWKPARNSTFDRHFGRRPDRLSESRELTAMIEPDLKFFSVSIDEPGRSKKAAGIRIAETLRNNGMIADRRAACPEINRRSAIVTESGRGKKCQRKEDRRGPDVFRSHSISSLFLKSTRESTEANLTEWARLRSF
jgi:hypothetical protein